MKKLVVVSATFMSITEKKEKELEYILYIWYLVTYEDQIKDLLNSKSEVNIMSQAFAPQLYLKTQKTNIEA